MAYISFQPKDYFNSKIYTGNGSTQSISSVGFQPDWVWLKGRSGSGRDNLLFDAIRSATNYIKSNATSAEATISSTLTSFDSDGFSIGSNGGVNANSETFVSWNWKANGTGSANTDGDINTTYTSANTTSGMSIIQYNGNGSAGATIGHGLGVAPKCVIIKRTDTTSNWIFGTGARGFDKFLYLNASDAETTNSGTFNNTAPSSSVITLGSWNDVNNASGTYIAYCFAEKQGFSKFGSYTGNGSTDGTFVYTGFKPALLIRKRTDAVNDWYINDNKRAGYNPQNNYLFPNSTQAESALQRFDFLSNGFKIRTTDGGDNASGGTYIYMAFSDQSIVSSNGVPAVAR